MEYESVLLQEVLITYKVCSVLRLDCEHSGIYCAGFMRVKSEVERRLSVLCHVHIVFVTEDTFVLGAGGYSWKVYISSRLKQQICVCVVRLLPSKCLLGVRLVAQVSVF